MHPFELGPARFNAAIQIIFGRVPEPEPRVRPSPPEPGRRVSQQLDKKTKNYRKSFKNNIYKLLNTVTRINTKELLFIRKFRSTVVIKKIP